MSETCDIAAAAALKNSGLSLGQFLALLVNIVNQIFISFVAVYMSYMCFKLKFKKTAFHAWFCSIGYCCLMAEGMMTCYDGNLLTHPFDDETRTTIHIVLQAVGGLMGMIGSLQKYLTKTKGHFVSFHAKIGLFSSCLCFFSFTSGTVSLYLPMPKKVIHTVISLIVFTTGMAAQFSGYDTGFFRRNVGDIEMKPLFKYIVIVTVVLSCISPVKNLIMVYLDPSINDVEFD